jgi:caa(3)-type oxidase subunit IV
MADSKQLTSGAAHAEHHSAKHATPGTYVAVLGALAVLTLIELIVVYLGLLGQILLLLIAISKAWLVLQFYMHLRYERKILTWIFLLPAVAVGILTAIMQFFVT